LTLAIRVTGDVVPVVHASEPAAAYNGPVDVFQLEAVLYVFGPHPLMVFVEEVNS